MSTSYLQERKISHSTATDADLVQRLRIALSVHKRAGWHLVRFTAENGIVQLAGVVPTFYDRQLIASLVRHVAGVFGIEDKLTVGDSSIRQQVIETETTHFEQVSKSQVGPVHDGFRHLPVIAQSLDDILTGAAAGVAHAF